MSIIDTATLTSNTYNSKDIPIKTTYVNGDYFEYSYDD